MYPGTRMTARYPAPHSQTAPIRTASSSPGGMGRASSSSLSRGQ